MKTFRGKRTILAFILLCNTTVGSEQIRIDGIAARVNESVITAGEVLAALAPARQQLMRAYSGEELRGKLETAYSEILDSLIGWRLVIAEYEEGKAKLPEWVVDNRIDDIIRDMFNGDKSALLAALAKDRMTYDRWREEIRNHIIVATMKREHVDKYVNISPQQVRDAYDKDRHKYKLPEMEKVRMIVIKKGGSEEINAIKRRQIEDIRKRIISGEDFAALARKVSEGAKASDGGDWGWINAGSLLSPELAQVAVSSDVGEVSKIIETAHEFYILKIEGRKNASDAAFEDVQAEIERDLRIKESARLYEAWIMRLKRNAYVEISSFTTI